jgi:undecaprenyl-diphosphatase
MNLQAAARRAGWLALGAIGLAMAARVARDPGVSDVENRSFRASNGLPDSLHGPLVVLMQFGSLGGALALGGLVAVRGPRRLGIAVAASATASWASAKIVKREVGRGRPAVHLADVRIRGRAQTGLGFPSGHAAVAVTAALVAGRDSGPATRAVLASAATLTAVARMYVGAHLPLDIVGGVALGVASANTTLLVLDALDDG